MIVPDREFMQAQRPEIAQKFKNKTDQEVFQGMAKKSNLCTLKYAFGFSEVACTFLNEIFQKDPQIVKDPKTLFKKLFKTFILSDKANSHPTVETFLQNLYQLGVDDSEKI